MSEDSLRHRTADHIAKRILVVRGQRVVVDTDLALLYGVTTKRLNEQIKRNKQRFPGDFVFRLTPAERDEVVANCDHLSKLRFSPSLPWPRPSERDDPSASSQTWERKVARRA